MLNGAGTIREPYCVRAQFIYMRPRRGFAVIGIILAVLAVWAVFDTRDPIFVGLVVFLPLYFLLYVPWSARRSYRIRKSLQDRVEVAVSEEGIRFQSPIGNVLMPWDYFIKWRRGRELILVFSGPRLFHMLPRHFFADDETFAKVAALIEVELGAPR